MPLAETRRSGLVDQVIEQLRTAIADGEWPIGERIPPEPELASTLGVSRNTVREAVRALAHGGLLQVRQGDGTRVRATSELSGAVRKLCGSELREVLQVRRALEVEGARLAATARTASDLRELRGLLDRRDAALAESPHDEFAIIDAEFHFAVVRTAHNTVLTELYRGMVEAITASVASTTTATDRAVHLGHRGLLEAIEARDAERAVAEAGGFLDELLATLS